jgi:sulfotransferase family protein
MKLIGASYPRMGTLSTKAALEHLGLGPCYHFVTQFERPQDVDVWQAAADGKPVDWTALFADFQAAVDWPASVFYKQLMALYPDAKVLLNVRDPETWYESMLQTVYPASRGGLSAPAESDMGRLGRMIDTLGWQGHFHGRFEEKAYALSVFERHNQEVQDYVPADRLLVWEVKEGWAPLCRFLGVAAPDTPFPRLNDAQTFRERFLGIAVG